MQTPRTERKHPFWPFLSLILIGAPVVYILSFGPSIWMCCQVPSITTLWELVDLVYAPILLAWRHGPPSVGEAISWYANLGADGLRLGIQYYPDGQVILRAMGSV